MIPALRIALTDPRLGPFDYRLLSFLVGELDVLECRRVKQLSLSRRLSVSVPTISRALTDLTLHGYLIQGPMDGRRRSYRLAYTLALPHTDATSSAA